MVLIRLPNSPKQYEREDQDRLRRAIESTFNSLKLEISGGGTGVLAVKSGDVVFAAGIGTIDFSSQFTLTQSPTGELNVSLLTPIARSSLPAQIAYEDEANTFIAGQVIGTDPGGVGIIRAQGTSHSYLTLRPNPASGSNEAGLEFLRSGGATWYVYRRADDDILRFYTSGDKMLLTNAALTPATAGLLTLGTSALPWGMAHLRGDATALELYNATLNARVGHRLFNSGSFVMDLAWEPTEAWLRTFTAVPLTFYTNNVQRWQIRADGVLASVGNHDLQIGSLGRFDSTDVPTDQQLLVYHAGAVNKWQAESIQFVRGSGDFKAALLADNTAAAYVLLDPGAGADSPVGAPPDTGAITVEVGHKAFTLSIPAYTKPADFRYFEWQTCTGASCSGWGALVNSTSRSVVHSRLTTGTVYRYRVRAVDRAGNASAFATTGDNTAAAQSDVQAFAGIIAGELAAVDLTALAGDIGILITGQMRGVGNTYGINFGGVGGIPAGWTAGINFEDTSLGSMTRYLNFHNGGGAGGTFIKHERLQIDFDGTVLMYQTSAQPLFKLNSSDFLLQNDAASPTQGLLIDGTRPAGWLRYLDLVDGVFAASDAQGSPILRVRAGKVGAGASDYGLQVFDAAAATIMDFTGAKRILAVPVQPSSDSGTAITVDLSTGLTQQVRLTGTATVTFTNPVNGSRYRVWFQQDGTGSRPFPTLVGPNGEVFMFTNDTPPTLTTTPGALDLFEFEYRTDPTTRFTVATLQANVLLPTPRVETFLSQAFSTSSTTHNVTMPSTVLPNEMLVVIIAIADGAITITTPSGWSHIATQAAQGAARLAVYAKLADGTEDGTSVDFVTSSAIRAAAHVYRWGRQYRGTVTDGIDDNTANGAASVNPNPPSHTTAWAIDRNRWIAAEAHPGNSVASVYPTNYGTNQTSTASGGGAPECVLSSANRAGVYAQTDDPSTFTIGSSQTWAAATIAIRPPA